MDLRPFKVLVLGLALLTAQTFSFAGEGQESAGMPDVYMPDQPNSAMAQNLPPNNPSDQPASEGEQVWQLPSTGKSQKIDTMELKNMDINDVFKLLSARTGLNIIAGRSVQGRVTMFLKDVDVREALSIILKANSLAFEESHGVLEIMTGDEYQQKHGTRFGIDIKTEVVDITYGNAEDIYKGVIPMLSSGIGHAEVDAATNRIVLTDTLPKLEVIKQFIIVMDRKGIETKTEVLDINYGKAEDILKGVLQMLTKGVGHAEFDAASNRIIVNDTRVKIDEIKQFVFAMDRKEKEVLIEARIIQVVLKDGYKMGINWEAILNRSNKEKVHLTNDFGLGASVSPKSITAVGTLSNADYQIVLDMIETMGRTKILSSPRIAAVNNQEAKILIGSTKPYVTTTSVQSSTGPLTSTEAINFIDVGVKLNVTPTIHDDGYVTMKIQPEISSAVGKVVTSQKNEIPVVEKSQVDTTVRVKDGVTIIIGGLIKDEIANTTDKVPFFGDMPFIGGAFRKNDRASEKTEIVIFLTPHIITGDIHVDPEKYLSIKGDKVY